MEEEVTNDGESLMERPLHLWFASAIASDVGETKGRGKEMKSSKQ